MCVYRSHGMRGAQRESPIFNRSQGGGRTFIAAGTGGGCTVYLSWAFTNGQKGDGHDVGRGEIRWKKNSRRETKERSKALSTKQRGQWFMHH